MRAFFRVLAAGEGAIGVAAVAPVVIALVEVVGGVDWYEAAELAIAAAVGSKLLSLVAWPVAGVVVGARFDQPLSVGLVGLVPSLGPRLVLSEWARFLGRRGPRALRGLVLPWGALPVLPLALSGAQRPTLNVEAILYEPSIGVLFAALIGGGAAARAFVIRRLLARST